jgi:ribulose-phosphate 3-epimerase
LPNNVTDRSDFVIQIAPSILNANLNNLQKAVEQIQEADWLHFDVMDGHFVPNLTFGPMFVTALRQVTDLPMEVHLMVEPADRFIPWYAEAGCRRIIIHAEGAMHLHRSLQMIKEYGCEAGVALNPATPPQVIECILSELDLVLLMTVNPGYGGQKFIPAVLPKIREVRRMIAVQQLNCRLEVDGGVHWDNIQSLVESGVDTLVAGTLIYNDPDPPGAIRRIREIAAKGR